MARRSSILHAGMAAIALATFALISQMAAAKQPGRASGPKLKLRWSDEFVPRTYGPCPSPRPRDGDDGGNMVSTNCYVNGGINTQNWAFEIGDGNDYGDGYFVGWGNNELQCYTSSPDNARVEANPDSPGDGLLIIQARATAPRNCYNPRSWPSFGRTFTSARLITRNKAAFRWSGTPGNSTAVRIEVRLKFPQVKGTWPAAWMLPDTPRTDCMACGPYGNGWAAGGEIDIMEHRNTDTQVVSNVWWATNAETPWVGAASKEAWHSLGDAAAGWHVYAVEWDATYLRFFADGVKVNELALGGLNSPVAPGNAYAPFDVPFYMILNMAVGGNFPGLPAGEVDTQAMEAGAARLLVDYVRVYEMQDKGGKRGRRNE